MERHVLIVESQNDFALSMATVLKSAGYQTAMAATAADAQREMEKRRPDLVVVRAELPDQSGFTLCGQIKRGKWGQNLKVLLLSSDTGVEGLSQHRQTPGAADGYLMLPFEMGELAAMSVGILHPEEEQPPTLSGDGPPPKPPPPKGAPSPAGGPPKPPRRERRSAITEEDRAFLERSFYSIADRKAELLAESRQLKRPPLRRDLMGTPEGKVQLLRDELRVREAQIARISEIWNVRARELLSVEDRLHERDVELQGLKMQVDDLLRRFNEAQQAMLQKEREHGTTIDDLLLQKFSAEKDLIEMMASKEKDINVLRREVSNREDELSRRAAELENAQDEYERLEKHLGLVTLEFEVKEQKLTETVQALEAKLAQRPQRLEIQTERSPGKACMRRRIILTVATEWSSGHGGLSTFNRELSIALARAGQEVYCYVPTASPQEVEDGERQGVKLLVARHSGSTITEQLQRRPPLPRDVSPDIVIGHGRVTGMAARTLVEDHFHNSQRVHFLHVAPGAIEWFKEHPAGDASETVDRRMQLEVELARSAHLVMAVGPQLRREYNLLLHPENVEVHEFLPGLDVRDLLPSPPSGVQVLLLGRAEDSELKGVDVAVRAVAEAEKVLRMRTVLVVRGAPPGEGGRLREKWLAYCRSPGFELRVLPYTSNSSEILLDIKRSSLVVMPSRSEGFGLAGLEALSAGIPVLLSDKSGLGEVIERFAALECRNHVVPVSRDLEMDSSTWGKEIEFVLRDRNAAFKRVRDLLGILKPTLSWDKSVNALLERLPSNQ